MPSQVVWVTDLGTFVALKYYKKTLFLDTNWLWYILVDLWTKKIFQIKIWRRICGDDLNRFLRGSEAKKFFKNPPQFEYYFFRKLYINTGIVLCYFLSQSKYWGSFMLILFPIFGRIVSLFNFYASNSPTPPPLTWSKSYYVSSSKKSNTLKVEG